MQQEISYQEWEKIPHSSSGILSRLKVPEGWIVRSYYNGNVSICFMPDADHIWLTPKISDPLKS